MKVIFGVDIGGTEIKFGAFSEKGDLIEKWSAETNLEDEGNKIVPDVAANIQEYININQIEMDKILGIGMGIPGPVDAEGHVKACVNLKWKEFNPAAELAKSFPKLRIAVENDANVAALGEYYKGCGKGTSSMMMITLGTGVGGGIIIDGKIISGVHGIAGEIGHIAVNGRPVERCSCGNRGCINECSSAPGLIRYAKHLLGETDMPSGLRDLEEMTAKDICDWAKQGDWIALQSLKASMEPLGVGMAYFSHAFDPEVYAIGGGVSCAGELLLDIIRKSYKDSLYLISKGAQIRLAELGNDAGITGACMLIAAKQGVDNGY